MTKRFPGAHRKEFRVFEKLDTPAKVQDFLDTLPINFERKGDTCRSPLRALRAGEIHCMEGALIAAAAFWYHGRPPLLLDLKTTERDESHVIALFKERGRWGAVSKTNHAVLRYRDPVFASPRELAMSYFNEYFLDNGRKTLRSHSGPFDLRRWEKEWLTAPRNLWSLVRALDAAPHRAILPPGAARALRQADAIEIEAGKLVEWKSRPRKRV